VPDRIRHKLILLTTITTLSLPRDIATCERGRQLWEVASQMSSTETADCGRGAARSKAATRVRGLPVGPALGCNGSGLALMPYLGHKVALKVLGHRVEKRHLMIYLSRGALVQRHGLVPAADDMVVSCSRPAARKLRPTGPKVRNEATLERERRIGSIFCNRKSERQEKM
jgi:hypothetical protein